MKKMISTIISVIVILTLIVLSLIFSNYALSSNQKETMIILLIICGSSVLYCFVVGEITRNNSQMDKLWSVLPIIYTWVIAIKSGFNFRCLIFAIIVTLWGVRLTYNFALKGAYKLKFWSGEEDYRWKILREKKYFKNKFIWALFDLFFISIYQNALVLAICFPSLVIMDSVKAFNLLDLIPIILALAFLTLEMIADIYQWNFHKIKKALLLEYGSLDNMPHPFNLGFNTTGPWGYMRHPNYLGEQGIWLSLALFLISAGIGTYLIFNWSLVGPLLLVFLFLGSSTLGEKISSSKYPYYVIYQQQVFKYLPIRKFNINKY